MYVPDHRHHIPLRLPRSPIKLRREIPSAAVDIEQGRRALTSLDKRIKINNLEEKIRVLKQELKNLRGKEGQKERNERDLVNKYQECKAENLRP